MTSGTDLVDQVDLHLKMIFILSFGHQMLPTPEQDKIEFPELLQSLLM